MRPYMRTTATWVSCCYRAVRSFVSHERKVVAFLGSLVFQFVFLMILAFLFFPVLLPGDDLSLDATFGESELLADMDLADNSVEVDGTGHELVTGPSLSTTAISPNQPVSSQPEVKSRSIQAVVRPPSPSISDMSNAEIIAEVPMLMAALPMHQHRGETRVLEAKGTQSVASTLQGDLTSIASDGDAVVVWMLDQSLSMQLDIKNLATQLSGTLQQIEENKSSTMSHYVVAFGSDVHLIQDNTTRANSVSRAIYNLPPDPSGIENTFQAVEWCVDNLFSARRWLPRNGRQERQKLLVLWTDESGDDYLRLEHTIQKCLAANVRVDIIGPSAVLGAQTGFTAFTHPEDGQVYQLPVHRGPDSAFPQKLALGYWYRGVPSNYNEYFRGPWPGGSIQYGGSNFDSLLSGFSPYALTRLSRQTGGRYTIFDRPADRPPFSLEQVRDYMPEYESAEEIQFNLTRQPLRQIVLASAAETWKSGLARYSQPSMAFPPAYPGEQPHAFRQTTLPMRISPGFRRAHATLIDIERALAVYAMAAVAPAFKPATEYSAAEDEFQDGLGLEDDQSEALEKPDENQKPKKSRRKSDEPKLLSEKEIKDLQQDVDISLLEQLYLQEDSKRWRAWCDLNLGRLLAISVRLREYLIVTEALYNNPNLLNLQTNEVGLSPSRELRGGAVSQQRAELARHFLQRCVDNNPNTPWSLMAQQELQQPFGLSVNERFIPVPPPLPVGRVIPQPPPRPRPVLPKL